MMPKDAKIFVAGHRGLVGSALLRALSAKGYQNIVVRTHAELDLTKESDVSTFFNEEKPDYIFLAAAKVGGILANATYPADFIYTNLAIQTNIIHSAFRTEAQKLLFLGSSCIYPRMAPQPIKEEYLLSAPLEPTNEAYAIAKIAGIKMCQSYNKQHGTKFISVMPTNLYGPNDNFDLQSSHVIPALIRKFDDAKKMGYAEVEVWGTGTPKREFLHVDDLASACIHLMNNHGDSEIINIGTGEDMSIKEIAMIIAGVVGFTGDIRWDTTKPDGTPRKLLDVSKLHKLGWRHQTNFREGISQTYQWYKETYSSH